MDTFRAPTLACKLPFSYAINHVTDLICSFYQCYDKWGIPGVYLSLTPIPTPGGCVIITLHSSTVSGADY
jgi:hypothetical protein